MPVCIKHHTVSSYNCSCVSDAADDIACCLPAAPAAGSAAAAAAVPAGKKIQVDWSIILGEAAVDIRVGRVTEGVKAGNICGDA